MGSDYQFTDEDRVKAVKGRKRHSAELKAFKAKSARYRELADTFGPEVALGVLAKESTDASEAPDRIRAATAYLRETRESESANLEQRSRLIDEAMDGGF